MEFWGVEVKSGEPLKVVPDADYIHISQAALGEGKKEKETVVLYLKFEEKKLVLGTLSRENFPQIPFDLVFEQEFELSHSGKNGSVYFCGYKANDQDDDDHSDEFGSEEDEDEQLPVAIKDNGKVGGKADEAKPAAVKGNAAKQVKVAEPKKDEDEDSDEDEDESDDEMDSLEEGDSLLDSSDSEDDDEDEETPVKKAEQGKKRPNDSTSKTPVSAKKAKLATPPKTDDKKGGHTATPHPMKKAGKTPATNDKSKDKTPKSAGQISCGSCNKTFNSSAGLEQHKKAKHGSQ